MNSLSILVVEDEEALREVIVFALESAYGAQIYEAESYPEAQKILSEVKTISHVVSDYHLADGTGHDVYQFIKDNNLPIEFILCTADHTRAKEFKGERVAGLVEKPHIIDPIKSIIDDLIRSSGEEIPTPPDFIRMNINHIPIDDLLGYDLYLKLSSEKYVKVRRKGDLFESADLKSFRKKSVQVLYVRKEGAKQLLNDFVTKIDVLAQAQDPNLEELYQFTKEGHEMIHQTILSVGVTPEVEKVTLACVNLAMKSMQKNSNLVSLLNHIKADPKSYLASHNSALSFVSCGLASINGWNSEVTYYKLSMASLLHDITLEDHIVEHLTSYLRKAYNSEYDDNIDISKFKEHPEHSAFLLKEFKDLPSGVETLILQHHEKPDGSGFPRGVNHKQISPLSSLFIIAEDVVDFVLESGESDNLLLLEYLRGRADHYRLGYFKKVFLTLVKNLESTVQNERRAA